MYGVRNGGKLDMLLDQGPRNELGGASAPQLTQMRAATEIKVVRRAVPVTS